MSARAGGFLVLLLLLPIGGAPACAHIDSEPETGEDDFTNFESKNLDDADLQNLGYSRDGKSR